MATRLKPTRINVDNAPRVWDWATYQNDNDFHWSMGGWDMEYRNFEWVTISWNALSLDNISSITTPTENFSVSVPAGTLKAGIEYHLRVNSGSTPYTMTLGTGVTNPNWYSIELKPNAITQFSFIATSDSQLELEWVDTSDFVTLGTQQTITAKKTFNVEPELGTAKTTDATNNGTKFATEAQVYKKADAIDLNTKTFRLASTSDTDNILAIGRYSYAWGNPIIIFWNQVYVKDSVSLDTITYRCSEVDMTPDNNTGLTVVTQKLLNITYERTWWQFPSEMYGCTTGTDTIGNVLQSGQNYTTPYTPEYNGSPATKKYVDDSISTATAGAVSDTAYDATTWDGVTWIAPSKNAVRDKIVTMDSAISGNTSNISTINGKIPSAASTSNQLADKNYVDDGINSVTAYYITKNAQGDQWATYAELAAATTFYSWWVQRTPTRNDYTIVLADENHDNATTRYIYNSGWEYQYTVNETAMSQAQLDAINSWITSWKVSTYDWYASTISWKQDALTLPATPTQWNLVVRWASNKTLADWWAIPTVPTNVSAFVNDAGYLTSETVVSGDSWTTYTIKVSNSEPAAWTPNTTITFVTN